MARQYLKKTLFVPFGANLARFLPKSDPPVSEQDSGVRTLMVPGTRDKFHSIDYLSGDMRDACGGNTHQMSSTKGIRVTLHRHHHIIPTPGVSTSIFCRLFLFNNKTRVDLLVARPSQ